MNRFGFGKKGEVVETQPPPEPNRAIFQRVWDMYTPKRYTPPPEASRGLPEGLFERVLKQESGNRHRDKDGNLITSPVGAQGISQVMPKTGRDPGYGVAPLANDSESEYIRFGKDLLSAYTNEFGGDIRKGLAAYNAGPGRIGELIKKYGNDWETKLPAETKNYLKKIIGNSTTYREAADPLVPGHTGKDEWANRSLQETIEEARKNPEFNTLQTFLQDRNAVPKFEQNFNPNDKGSFTTGVGHSESGTLKVTPGRGVIPTVVHEMTHAAARQFRRLEDEIDAKVRAKQPLTQSEQQFKDAFGKTVKYGWNVGDSYGNKNRQRGMSKASELAMALDAKWFTKNENYRTSGEELPAHALGTVAGATRRDDNEVPTHFNQSIATDFMMVLDLAQRVQNERKQNAR